MLVLKDYFGTTAMELLPGQSDSEIKRAILRGVYEENTGQRKPKSPRSPTVTPVPPAPAKPHSSRLPLLLILLLPGALLVPRLSALVTDEAEFEDTNVTAALPGPRRENSSASKVISQLIPVAEELPPFYPVEGRAPLLAGAPWNIDLLATPEEIDLTLAPFKHQSPLAGDYDGILDKDMPPLAALFGLQVRTIVIDPGHGGKDPGTTGDSGLQEKEVALDIARRLRARLARHGRYRVLLTRTDDNYLSLKARTVYANENNADLFISLHLNYIPEEPVAAVETYYFGAQSDAKALRVAELENRGSEFAMAEFRGMIEKIGNTFKHQESKTLASAIQNRLYRQMKSENRNIRSWGIKSAPFAVLLGADMPSVLAEITCLSNNEEEEKLRRPEYRENIAAYLESGIIDYLGTDRNATQANNGDKLNGSEKESG